MMHKLEFCEGSLGGLQIVDLMRSHPAGKIESVG